MRRDHVWRAMLAGAGLMAASAAPAQTTQTPVQPQPSAPNMPAPQTTVPDRIAPRPGDTTGSTGTLSDRLEATDGVIRPNDTGTSTSRTIVPTDPGTTPVIPPAGTPGSQAPNAIPK